MHELLERMRRNPAGDWSIRDIETLCQAYGIRCSPPTGGGSHYKISHPAMRDILTVPFRKPVKPVYIRKLVRFVEAAGANSGRP
jgi:hypothetical protein